MSAVPDIKTTAHKLIDSIPDQEVSWEKIVRLLQENVEDPLWSETMKGLADVEAGRVVDGGKVLSWIESWGTDQENNLEG